MFSSEFSPPLYNIQLAKRSPIFLEVLHSRADDICMQDETGIVHILNRAQIPIVCDSTFHSVVHRRSCDETAVGPHDFPWLSRGVAHTPRIGCV